MNDSLLVATAQVVLVAILGALLVIVAFKLLAGQIKTRGLLADKKTGSFSPGRLQLLVATLGGAAFYFFNLVSATDTSALPPVPTELLLIVGASNAGYLSGKVYSKFFKNS